MGTQGPRPGRGDREQNEVETRDALGGPAVSRRGFLGIAAASVAAAAMPGAAEAFGGVPASPQPIGLQLYTVRDLMQKDVEGTLRQVAAVGYKEVEFAGLFDRSAVDVKKMLTKYGLTSPSSHIPLERLKANLQGAVDECRTLGNQYIVCPWIDEKIRKSADDWKSIAADLNKIGDSLQRVGMGFAYHNHDFEFAKQPTGEMGYDILTTQCDPKFVKMELDLYWITKGGQDPLAYFAKFPGRFPLVHVKDMGSGGTIVNVGQGKIDWNHIFSKRREAGIEHFYVERDNPTSPIDDIKVSYTYMSRLGL
jgi:sugar phosphate isomerase/epimerase